MINFLDRIKQFFAPIADEDVTNKKYVDDRDATKAEVAHGHSIGDVTNLQTSLNGKAASSHSHAIGDVTSLQTSLNGKAPSSHSHSTSDISGLSTAISNAISAAGGGSSAPKPTSSSGVGQWTTFGAVNSPYGTTLPSGGTWAYFALYFAGLSESYDNAYGIRTFSAGVAAGGTNMGSVVGGLAWRIA